MSESDVLVMAITQEMGIDELGPVVGVDAEQRHGRAVPNL